MEGFHNNLEREFKLSLIEKRYLFKCFFTAFFLRIFMISLIYLFRDVITEYLYLDDFKYESYAKIYSTVATSIIDPDGFRFADMELGGVVVAQLFFRLNAIIYYLTNSVVVLRVINALFSACTILPIYLIAKELFGVKEAKISSLLYACMPYHIMMSSFLFKDTLIALLFSSSLYMIIKFYRTGKINLLLFLFFTIPQEWLRNGLPLFLFGLFALTIFIKLYKKSESFKLMVLIIFPLIGLLIIKLFFIDNIELLMKRMDIYLSHGRVSGGTIDIVRIDNIKQIYKLPLTWIFSTLPPLSFNTKITDWKDIMGMLHYSYLFIVPGYIFYSIFTKKSIQEKLFFYPLIALHLLIIIAVLGIPRHYYFLHFYIIICASAFIGSLTKRKFGAYLILVTASIILFLIASILITIK